MRIALLQPRLSADSAERNMAAARRLMDKAGGADLYLLPEMWATGFLTAPTRETEEATAAALRLMRGEAAHRRAAVAGSLPVRGADGWRNRFFLTRPDGTEAWYDKRHLFFPAGEDRLFTPGKADAVTECGGTRIMPQICFDLRFPETCRNSAAAPYDLLLCAAGWPAARIGAWDALLRARAVENLAYCVGVNCCGTLRGTEYGGHSAAYAPTGERLAFLGRREGVAVVELDLEALRSLRKSLPVLIQARSNK